ncbi:MAG: class I SAM-dependent methyltransferase [Lachnospiraceae bacterium]|nr:class I SAM-dependent methyltransferase [Lachnospiraceae bacterium]
MEPVVLSERLRAVASMVTPGVRVCDVGCDHGFVSIWLVERRISPCVLAMDVREGPLGAARKHVMERDLESRIETRLSDGLHNYKIGEADSLICAGMGGRLMMRILGEEKVKTDSFRELILQPQSELMEFRAWLREHGLRITAERMVEEDGKFYPMMRAVPEAGALTTKEADEVRCSGDSGMRRSDVCAERSQIRGVEREELCKLADRYGGFLLLQGDRTLLAFLQKEERIYTEILGRLRGQGLDCDRRRMRYAEVETLLSDCRRAQEIALRRTGCES